MKPEPELLPCPFCGSKVKITKFELWESPDCGGHYVPGHDRYYIDCDGCNLKFKCNKEYVIDFPTEETCFKAWNTRPKGKADDL